LIDGASACRAAPTSPLDSAFSTSRAPKRSIGTAESNTVRLRAREPTMVTWSMAAAAAGGSLRFAAGSAASSNARPARCGAQRREGERWGIVISLRVWRQTTILRARKSRSY
jgi:hypothetical protein